MNTETIIVRLEKQLRDKIAKDAKSKGLSLSAYVRMILKANV
jgi:predicted HicB family RNase H-like nuclease